jgi:hypothetical protein
MAICLHGEQRRECVAFRPRIDLAARIPSTFLSKSRYAHVELPLISSELAIGEIGPEHFGSWHNLGFALGVTDQAEMP